MPPTHKEWLSEIAEAYLDAYEAIPFGQMVGQEITEKELFHMAPEICLKFRGIKRSKKKLDIATEAMLSSYIATEDQTKDIFKNPLITFCFAYMVCHFAIGLLQQNEVAAIMNYMEEHQEEIKEAINKRITNGLTRKSRRP